MSQNDDELPFSGRKPRYASKRGITVEDTESTARLEFQTLLSVSEESIDQFKEIAGSLFSPSQSGVVLFDNFDNPVNLLEFRLYTEPFADEVSTALVFKESIKGTARDLSQSDLNLIKKDDNHRIIDSQRLHH